MSNDFRTDRIIEANLDEYDEALEGTVHVHANGVVEVDPADIRATVCGACGRAWDDSVATAWTPAPAGRCPFEYEHDDDDETGRYLPGEYAWQTKTAIDLWNDLCAAVGDDDDLNAALGILAVRLGIDEGDE